MPGKILHTPAILELGPAFYDEVLPATFPKALLRYKNATAAAEVGLDALTPAQFQEHLWAFQPLPGNLQKPLALRYHGNQFRHYNPDLGDGRGFLYAQFSVDGKLLDLGTKGSGQTPYSRDGDGRLTLKGAFREALATEMLETLGVNTSKTFCFYETGESLVRHDEPSPTRAAVLTRMSHGHIRIGTFQRLWHFQDKENIQRLTDYCLKYYYPEVHSEHADERAFLFFQGVIRRCAALTAQWMMAGFVHGVLNSDNINISGESFDYGPYRFLPQYDLHFTAAYFDRNGLYCYGRQPTSMLWNLQQLGRVLNFAYENLPVEELLEDFADEFNAQTKSLFLRRMNLQSRDTENDEKLLLLLFKFMQESRALFEQTFWDLHSGGIPERLQKSPQAALYELEFFGEFKEHLATYKTADPSKMQHPRFQTPQACSLLIDEIEALWKPIAENDDWSDFEAKLQDIRSLRGFY